MTLPPRPSFLIIGAQKSATRWLRTQLGEHPDIYVSDTEIEYFNHHFHERPIEWYRQQFHGWAGESFVGEATPGYMFHADDAARSAARIHLLLGSDVRLFAVLREPVARLRSAYIHHLRRGRIPSETDPVELLTRLTPDDDPLGLITGGWYGRSLEPFALRFGHNLLVLYHDDVVADPETVMTDALAHLGATPFTSPTLHEVTNSGVRPLARRHPDHPILELGTDHLRDIVGHWFDGDADRIEALSGRRPPWADTKDDT
jgi:hypothetical protein